MSKFIAILINVRFVMCVNIKQYTTLFDHENIYKYIIYVLTLFDSWESTSLVDLFKERVKYRK